MISPTRLSLNGSDGSMSPQYVSGTGRMLGPQVNGPVPIQRVENRDPIVIVIAQGHGFVSGDFVTVYGVRGTTDANGSCGHPRARRQQLRARGPRRQRGVRQRAEAVRAVHRPQPAGQPAGVSAAAPGRDRAQPRRARDHDLRLRQRDAVPQHRRRHHVHADQRVRQPRHGAARPGAEPAVGRHRRTDGPGPARPRAVQLQQRHELQHAAELRQRRRRARRDLGHRRGPAGGRRDPRRRRHLRLQRDRDDAADAALLPHHRRRRGRRRLDRGRRDVRRAGREPARHPGDGRRLGHDGYDQAVRAARRLRLRRAAARARQRLAARRPEPAARLLPGAGRRQHRQPARDPCRHLRAQRVGADRARGPEPLRRGGPRVRRAADRHHRPPAAGAPQRRERGGAGHGAQRRDRRHLARARSRPAR